MSLARLEAFSDGVIAIAITLLVLDIKVPEPGGGGLGRALAEQWPSYVAYVISFVTIGIIWINHHAAVARLARADHSLLVLNLLLLLTIGLLPFTTSLMAAYLRESDGEHLAGAVYAGSFLLMGCAFYGMQRYALADRAEPLHPGLPHDLRRLVLRRNALGIAPYAVAVVVAPLSAYASLGICGAVAIYYALPGAS